MDGIKNFFSKLYAQFNQFWSQQDMMRKGIFIAIGIASIVGIAFLVLNREQKPNEYIFVNLSPEDNQAILNYFKQNNITDYSVDSKGIQVPVENMANIRIKLAQEGIPSQGSIGWEKFDKQDFTRTEFEQKIHRLRAIQGELARTITQIDGVSSARVHIVTPQPSLFVEDKKEPTAAVYLKLKPSQKLSERQIRGIVHLVSKSVEGLQPDNITIIDQEGKMLTDEKSKDPATQQTKEMLTYKKDVERELEQKIRGIVGKVAGYEKVDARVDVSLDYTKEEMTISDIDPDRIAVISSNVTNQDISGQGLNPTGIPGAKSNVPGDTEEATMSSSQAKSTRGSERLNYEIAKTTSHKVLPVGTIKRISAAVIVDGKQTTASSDPNGSFQARTEEEMKKIEELVKTAIGFREGRDEVKVHNMHFQLDVVQTTQILEEKRESRAYISNVLISLAATLALVLFFAFIVRPYFRWLAYDPQRKQQETTIQEFSPELEVSGVQSVQVKEDIPFDKMSPQEQVMFLARHEPQRTTEAIRILLNPHGGSH